MEDPRKEASSRESDSTSDPDQYPRWREIAEKVAEELGLTTRRSPTLQTVIERGVRYIVVAKSARELVFDTRALFLGFVLAGQENPDSIRYGNTASWFVAWLSQRVGADVVAQALARSPMSVPEDVFEALSSGFAVKLSISVRALLGPAAEFSRATVGRSAFEARHLFSAMIVLGAIRQQVRQLLRVDLEAEDLDELKTRLVERIMGSPDDGETEARWERAFGRTTSSGAQAFERAAATDGVSPFASDIVAGGMDVLETEQDVRILARLICLDDAAPLAIAVLGGWGSGKSTFMSRLDAAVDDITGKEARRPEVAGVGKAKFVRRVVQVRFNAWQFVDASLWASLTAEFFDQLRAGGWNNASRVRYAGLISRVNSHVHALNADLVKKRGVVAEGGKTLRKAQHARDEAATAAAYAEGDAVGQATLDMLGDLYESQKGNLSALGLRVTGSDTAKAIDAVLDAVKMAHSVVGQMALVWRVATKTWWRVTYVVSVALLAVAGLAWALLAPWANVVALLTGIAALGATAQALAPALRLVTAAARRAGGIAAAVQAADETTLSALLKSEAALREAAREAEARQAAAKEAERLLGRYVDDDGSANPPRLLRYVLEDDPNTKTLQGELGLIGRTRRLFQAVNDIVQEERRKSVAQGRDLDVPDRIVLYIDDLDRCSEDQVYSVLQAIHLLLAFELFVVVVGVDVEWVENALVRPFGGGGATSPVAKRQLAARYLEKIFQVAFWLQPLTSGGKDGGTYSRYVNALTERDLVVEAEEEGSSGNSGTRPRSGTGPVAGGHLGSSESGQATGGAQGSDVLANPELEALDTIKLEAVEVGFLASPTMAAIAGKTPRSVKRLVNVYRLVRARLLESGVDVLGVAGRTPVYPLIALVAAIETGQPVSVADAFLHGLNSLAPDDLLTSGSGESRLPTHFDAIGACPGLWPAITEVTRLRNGDLRQREALSVAHIARRYSFNRQPETPGA